MRRYFTIIIYRNFILSLLILFSGLSASNGQILRPLDEGLGGPARAAAIYQSKLHVIWEVGKGNDLYSLSSWDGKAWKELATFRAKHSNDTLPLNMLAHGSQLVITGPWDTLYYKGNTYKADGIISFDGSFLVDYFQGVDSLRKVRYISSIQSWNGGLYIAGEFDVSSADSMRNIAVYRNNFRPRYLGSSATKQGLDKEVTGMVAYNNELYAYGYFTVVQKSFASPALVQVDSFTLDSLPLAMRAHGFANIQAAATYKSKLWAYGFDNSSMKLKSFDGSSWTDMTGSFASDTIVNPQIRQLLNFNDTLLYALGSFQYKGVLYPLAYYSGNKWKVVKSKMSVKNGFMAVINNTAFVGGDISSPRLYLGHFAQLDEYNGRVSGRVYVDKNGNCQYSGGFDKPLDHILVTANPGNYHAYTDTGGNYSFILPPGNYAVTAEVNNYYQYKCTGATIIGVAEAGEEQLDGDFALHAGAGITDLKLEMLGHTGWRARAGFTEKYTLCAENTGLEAISIAYIKLRIPRQIRSYSSSPAPDVVKDSVLIWYVQNLKATESRCIKLEAEIDVNAISYDTVGWYARADSTLKEKDAMLADNYDTLLQKVVSSFDPNDKQCFPEGKIRMNTEEIKYLIRFQNTGTDTAYRVTVIDTIDTDVPLNELRIGACSHNFRLSVESNVLRWTFDNILLPDSNTNEPLSHGHISYASRIKKGMAIGTEITNKAYIYFDYQKPVETNLVMARLDTFTSIEPTALADEGMRIYPNPASSELQIKNESSQRRNLHIYSATGQQMAELTLQGNMCLRLDISLWQQGIYFVTTDGGGVQRVVVAR